jgi:hypothetical protein
VSRADSGRSRLWLGAILLAAFIPALGVLPYYVRPPDGVASAAALAGYNNAAAFWAVLLVALVGLAGCALFERRRDQGARAVDPGEPVRPAAVPWSTSCMVALVAVAAAVAVAHWPSFLARYGPYREDSYFLSVLHRMDAGQKPYQDFETLYGPLMLYLPYWWTRLFGYSMTAYFGLIALLEAALSAVLLWITLRYVTSTRQRVFVFLLFLVFAANVMLGLGSNGIRRLFPVLVLLIAAYEPTHWRTVLTAALVTGVGAAYSHEFGALALVTLGALYGTMFLRRPSRQLFGAAAIAIVTAAATWLLCCWLILGPLLPTYLQHAVYGAGRFAQEASFAFSWTGHSLATFALLAIAIVVVGCGLGGPWRVQFAAGDVVMVGGLVYALLALRSGLNRADMWHLTAAMLGLFFAFLLPLPRRVCTVSPALQRAANVLIIVIAVTYLVGMAPAVQYVVSGYLRGARDVFLGSRTIEMAVTRAPTIETERSEPSRALQALGEYLAARERRDRPVVPYSTLWWIDKRAGFRKTIYPTDDFLLSDEMGEDVREYLSAHPDSLVLIAADEHARLAARARSEPLPPGKPLFGTSLTKRIIGWLSTIEYGAAEDEHLQKGRRWDRTVGAYLIVEYRVVTQFDTVLVMARDRTGAPSN